MEKSQTWEKTIDDKGNEKMILIEEKEIEPLKTETPEEKFIRLMAEAEEVKKLIEQQGR